MTRTLLQELADWLAADRDTKFQATWSDKAFVIQRTQNEDKLPETEAA